MPIGLDDLTARGPHVDYYFDNLLPDSEPIRRRVQSRYAITGRDPIDLLAAIGRDCVGAIQLLPEGEKPTDVFTIRASALSEVEVERRLLAVLRSDKLTDDDDDLRISLAGAQEKTALTRHRGRWCVPHGSTPTTHIFKLPLGFVGARELDLRSSVENEWLCARLLSQYGLPVARSELMQFGDTKTLVVTRFDRRLHDSRKYWLRLPQEDFCQATRTPSSAKYESDGGPGLLDIAALLQASEAREEDLKTLLRTQLLFWMLAATDGHAKNFSIHVLAQGRFRLTPLYDVISAWPVVGKRHNQLHERKLKLAMALRGTSKHYRIAEIRRDHFTSTARMCGLGSMDRLISSTVEATPGVIDRVGAQLPKDFPVDVFEAITNGLRRAAQSLAAQAPRD